MIIYETPYVCANGQVVVLNKNPQVVQNIRRRCELNEGHCPCSSVISEDTLCPCKELRTEGVCHCGLYKQLLID